MTDAQKAIIAACRRYHAEGATPDELRLLYPAAAVEIVLKEAAKKLKQGL